MIIIAILIFIVLTFSIAYLYIANKEKNLLDDIYHSLSKEITKSTNTLIDNKKNATMAMAIPLSKNYDLISAYINDDFSNLKFRELSNELKQNTNYQNVWIQIINQEGITKYRSWSGYVNDKIIDVRDDLKETFRVKIPRKVISLGAYDLTFKASVPIFKDDEFLGVMETITKFNSIAKSIEELGFKAVVLANKNQTNKLKYPFSKNFLQGFYISNINVDKKVLNYLESKNIQELINLDSFKVLDNYLITNIKIEEDIANILLFKKLDSIDVKPIHDFKKQAFTILFIVFFMSVFKVSNFV